MKEKILIVEDEFIVANDLRIMLTKAGYTVCGIAPSGISARRLMDMKKPDWVLLDIKLKGDITGIDLAWELLERKIPFIYISANADQNTLSAAKETQPYGFMVKPFRERDLLVMLDIARYKYGLEKRQPETPASRASAPITGIIGHSDPLVRVIEKIRVVAPSETSVLVLGESGTGKERVAHAIHQLSSRASKPLITVNCAALAPSLIESELFGHERGAFTGANIKRTGKFEQADSGTIFLDEIGELPLDSQAKLLRVLQEKEIERLGSDRVVKVDIRIIAATNRLLEKEVAEGRFRLDLYYRLNVFPLELPPLRERKEDIGELAHYFIKQYALKARKNVTGISEQTLSRLKEYDWPGNIRELEHVIERNVLLTTGSEIVSVDLPDTANVVSPDNESNPHIKTMEEMERNHIMNALKACNGKVFGSGGAAEILNIPAATLYSKMKKLGIKQRYT